MTAAIISLVDSTEEESLSDYEYHWGNELSSNSILSIPITGPILDERPDALGSFDPFITTFAAFGTEIKEQLYRATDDPEIQAIILEINSPGGTVTGSKAIADGIAYAKQAGKPIYAFGSGLMASGGYWVAAGTDVIWVETGSLVGSIGVIGGQFATYNEVIELNEGLVGPGVTTREGIDVTTITAGEGKDFGNPFRQPTEKELAIAQESTDQIYQVFVNHVSNTRGISSRAIVEDIGAYVYGERQALSLRLIDQIGNREHAYDALATKLDISQDYKIVREIFDGGFFASLFSTITQRQSQAEASSQSSTCIYSRKVMVYFGNVLDLCNWFRWYLVTDKAAKEIDLQEVSPNDQCDCQNPHGLLKGNFIFNNFIDWAFFFKFVVNGQYSYS